MKKMIYGLNPTSLIDYPDEFSFVIYTGGCNFNCPYCHNKNIVNKNTDTYSEEEVLKMLKERKGFFKAVVITGGEPTIHGIRLINFIKDIKKLGYKIKLDSNGSNPKLLKEIIKLKIIDFIAIDLKNTYEQYEETIGRKFDLNNLKESIKLVENSNIEYQLRTTVNKTMHNKDTLLKILTYLKNKEKLVLQPYRYNENQIRDFNFGEYTDEELEQLKKELQVEVH